MIVRWWRKHQKQKYCLHHDIGGNPANSHQAVSWIKQAQIDTGRRKMFWCIKCDKSWIV